MLRAGYTLVVVVVITLSIPVSAAAKAAIMTPGKSVTLQLVCYITQQAPLLVRKASVGTLSSRQQQRSTSRSKLCPSRSSSKCSRAACLSSCRARLVIAVFALTYVAISKILSKSHEPKCLT